MIVWLNGSFGAGKTSTAAALKTLWPDAIVFDPELLGVGLRLWTPQEARVRDFQDIQLWRDLVVATCSGLVAEWGRPLIVPMTMLRPAYFEQTIGRLRDDHEVHHFCLTAPPAVLRARAAQRAHRDDDDAATSMTERAHAQAWIEERWAEYDAFDPRFSLHIDTTQGSATDVAQRIAQALPQPLPQRLPSARWSHWAPPPAHS